METKRYFVSIPIKVYSSFNINVVAESKEKAIDVALDKYDDGDYEVENIAEPDWIDSELCFNCNDDAYVEEKIFDKE